MLLQDSTQPEVQYYLDGAHTEESLEVCTKWFESECEQAPQQLRILIFNCASSRNPEKLLQPLSEFYRRYPFAYALFCPNVISSASSSSAASSASKDAKHLAQYNDRRPADTANSSSSKNPLAWPSKVKAIWLSKTQQSEEHLKVFSCISSCLDWLRDFAPSLLEDHKRETNKAVTIQVLVTGSLHLVGGVLATLGSEVQ